MYRQVHTLAAQIQKGLQSNAMNGINFAALEDGTDRLSRNLSTKLPLLAA